MAKVSLSKITPIKKVNDVVINIGDEQITVKQYLPVDEKVALVERVLNAAIDETNYFSCARLNVYSKIEIIKAYTNINFTDKQLEDAPKLFDLLQLNGIIQTVLNAIPENEYHFLQDMIYDDADRLGKHLNSFVGMIKLINQNQIDTEDNINSMLENLQKIADNSTLQTVVNNELSN